ncbi:efflux RND transporter periplasmic adaptor subunit [Synechococcus sp. UW179A]|uniref:efflux RND transporter periplasmic adaptor subunit n=1 Tax=Synechococcus sp. UW179A TaxID=2575510 RepID=UPI000E0F8EF1|nr:efflux RND transporter periplasmic adaptor subunit [Synechococcus sp. UW179A]
MPTNIRSKIRLAVKVGFICGLSCLMASCQTKSSAPQAFPVDVTRIQTRDFAKVIEAEGTLTNPGYIRLTPQVSGLITKVFVKEGDPVTSGQVLVVLDNAQEIAEFKTAQAQFKEADLHAKRVQWLFEKGAESKESAEEARVTAIGKNSNLVAKQEALGRRSIRSPINGIVGDLSGVNPGQYFEQGNSSFFVVNNENLSIDLSVPALQASKIKLGQQVKMLDESKRDVIGEGEIAFIPPYFEFDSSNSQALNTLKVRAVFVNEKAGLRPGQLIRSKIMIGNQRHPGVPATAVLFKAQQPYTYKLIPIQSFLKNADVNPQQKKSMSTLPSTTLIAVNTPLKLGNLQDDYFPVLSGLKVGDLIPTSGSTVLANGTPVSIKSSK